MLQEDIDRTYSGLEKVVKRELDTIAAREVVRLTQLGFYTIFVPQTIYNYNLSVPGNYNEIITSDLYGAFTRIMLQNASNTIYSNIIIWMIIFLQMTKI